MADRLLKVLFWETTAACNLACRHCRRGESRGAPAPGELSTAEAVDLIRGVASWARPLLVLSGGEPLMRGDIVEIASGASGLGLPVAVATNGTLADAPTAAALARAGVRRVGVSLDGASAGTHDRVRGVAGSFEGAVRGLRLFREAGIRTQVNMTVCRGNTGEVEDVFRLACREGAAAVHLFVLVPVGCGLAIAGEEALSGAEERALFDWFHARAGSFGPEARLTCAPHYVRFASGRGPSPRTAASGCLCGRSICFVSHLGETYPCGYLPVSAGNVRREGLRPIWDDSPLFRRLREPGRLGPPCGACGFREACGGCRARAYAETGDIFGGDRSCVP